MILLVNSEEVGRMSLCCQQLRGELYGGPKTLKWGVKFHIQRVCANKGEAQAFGQRLRFLFALAERDQNAGPSIC